MARRSKGGSIVLKGDAANDFFQAMLGEPPKFRAADGEKCDRCGETWGRANNTPNSVYHLCLVPDRLPLTTSGLTP